MRQCHVLPLLLPGPRGGRGVEGVRARDHPAARRTFPYPPQIAVGLQLPQGEGDAVTALGEPVGEGADVDGGAVGQRQDVRGEPDRERGHLAVLGEVVADDRVPVALVLADVGDTGVGGGSTNTARRA